MIMKSNKAKRKSAVVGVEVSGSAVIAAAAQERSLLAAAKKFSKAWGAAAQGDIKARYALAQDALTVEEKHGRVGVEALANEINRSASYVYSYAAVAKTWTAAALHKLLKLAAGKLEWSHLTFLSNQKRVDATRRAELLTQIIGEKLSPTALKLVLYPKAAPEDLDPDLVEDGVVGDEPAPATGAVETAETSGTAAAPVEVEEEGADEGDEEEPAVAAKADTTARAPKMKVVLTSHGSSLRTFASELSALAAQIEEVNNKVFDGIEEALRTETAPEAIDATLQDLASTKNAAEDAARFNKATIKRCNELMDAAKAKIAKRTSALAPDATTAVQMSGMPQQVSATMSDVPAVLPGIRNTGGEAHDVAGGAA